MTLRTPLTVAVAILAALTPIVAAMQGGSVQQSDELSRLSYFVGEWRGIVSGEPGNGAVERKYESVLNGRFFKVVSRSTYPSQEKNKNGEIHQDVGFFSYDKDAKKIILRQFHVEGFVNTYRESSGPGAAFLTLETTEIENIPAGWRARETYTIVNNDEFIERFELAQPGKEFSIYAESRLKRIPAHLVSKP